MDKIVLSLRIKRYWNCRSKSIESADQKMLNLQMKNIEFVDLKMLNLRIKTYWVYGWKSIKYTNQNLLKL